MFNSIRSKIWGLCLGGMFFLALAMGLVTMFAMDKLTEAQEIETMNRKAEYAAQPLNKDLQQVQNIVQFAANHVKRNVSSPESLNNAVLRERIAEDVASSFNMDIAGLSCVSAYYLHFSEPLAGPAQGFLYIRRWNGDPFQNIGMYDVTRYPVDDVRHTSWYWGAVQAKKLVWTEPNFSEEQQRFVICCTMPIYVDNLLVAVVGVDVSFADILERTEKLTVYENGKAVLVNNRGEVVYDKENPTGCPYARDSISEVRGWSAWELDSTDDRLMGFKRDGVEYDAAFTKLQNGMKLLVYANTDEVFKAKHRTMRELSIGFALVLVLFACIAALVADRMTKSLYNLSVSAQQLAEGNFNIDVDIRSKDEIGTLARAFHNMAIKLQEAMQNLKDKNTHDALTGLLNRLGMDEMTKTWMEQHKGEPAALITLDLDNFKFINDLYSHAAGDEALRTLASNLSSHFGEKAYVGRNGGDEFVVFLPQVSAEDTEALVKSFSAMKQSYSYEGTKRVFTVSIGYVTYPDQAADLAEMFKHADAALYNIKLKGKHSYARYEADAEILSRTQLGFNLDNIAMNMPGGMMVYEARGEEKILYVNQEVIKMFGCSTLEEFLNYTNGSFLHVVHPEDIFRVEDSIWKQIVDNMDSMDFIRYRILTKQGEVKRIVDAGRLVKTSQHGDVFYCMLIEEKD